MTQYNLIGALSALYFYFLTILIFICRLFARPEWGTIIGYFLFLLFLPLIYLLINASEYSKSHLFYIQLFFVFAYLLIELFADYIFKIPFRNIQWMTIIYAVFFFSAAGGFIGIASNAGREWSIASIVLFFLMTILAFIQRKITGM